MAYEKTNWTKDTPINTANLNKMEAGIEEAAKTGGVSTGSVIGWTGGEIPEGYEEVDSSLIPSNSGVEVGTIVHINKKKPTPDGWKDLEGKNIIVAYPINGQKVTTAAQSTVMKLEAEYFQKGTGFSIKNGEIVVGEGINNIKISGNIRINDIAAGDVVFGRLYVDSDIFDNIRVVNSTAVNGNRHTFAFSEFVLKVAKGDRIGIALQNNTSGRGSVYSDEYCSYIKVESIDDTKLIEKASVTPIEGKTGHIYDTTNIDNKTTNTYSANIIDENFLNKGKIIIHRNLSCKFSSNVAIVDISSSGFTDNNYIGFVAFPYNNIYDAKLVADTTTQAKIQCSSISDGSYYVNIFIIKA